MSKSLKIKLIPQKIISFNIISNVSLEENKICSNTKEKDGKMMKVKKRRQKETDFLDYAKKKGIKFDIKYEGGEVKENNKKKLELDKKNENSKPTLEKSNPLSEKKTEKNEKENSTPTPEGSNSQPQKKKNKKKEEPTQPNRTALTIDAPTFIPKPKLMNIIQYKGNIKMFLYYQYQKYFLMFLYYQYQKHIKAFCHSQHQKYIWMFLYYQYQKHIKAFCHSQLQRFTRIFLSYQHKQFLMFQKEYNKKNDNNNSDISKEPITPFFYHDHKEEVETKEVISLIEVLFTYDNLNKDFFLRKMLDEDGFVTIENLATHPQMKKFGLTYEKIKEKLIEHRQNEITETVETFDTIKVRNREWNQILGSLIPTEKVYYCTILSTVDNVNRKVIFLQDQIYNKIKININKININKFKDKYQQELSTYKNLQDNLYVNNKFRFFFLYQG